MNKKGLSLISALVAMVILGFGMTTAVRAFSLSFRVQSSIELRDELLTIKRRFRDELNCKKTLEAQPCQPGQYFPIKDSLDRVIGKPSLGAWRIGRYHYRASCSDGEMKVERARPISDSQFASEPFTRQVMSWKPLNEQGEDGFSCKTFFSIPPDATPLGEGKCILRTKSIDSTAPLGPNNQHRTKMINCPADFPVLMSANTTPACNSHEWIADLQYGDPSRGICSVILLADRLDIDTATKNAAQTDCDNLNLQTTTALCRVVCCAL